MMQDLTIKVRDRVKNCHDKILIYSMISVIYQINITLSIKVKDKPAISKLYMFLSDRKM